MGLAGNVVQHVGQGAANVGRTLENNVLKSATNDVDRISKVLDKGKELMSEKMESNVEKNQMSKADKASAKFDHILDTTPGDPVPDFTSEF